jgi:putative protein-disulfide isomerase
MCSWCWGYRPTWEQLRSSLPAGITVHHVLGGLAPDSLEPMPVELQAQIQGHWRRIRDMLGTRFNFDFWTKCEPRRSTYPACRAVLAAIRQHREEDMILAIQQAYYLRALNPSDDETLLRLAGELGMDTVQFTADLGAPETQNELLEQVRRARQWRVPGFPSLVLEAGDSFHPIALDYRDYRATREAIGEFAGD